MKVKQSSKKINISNCTNCFKSKHIVFNFAYITYNEFFEKEEKATLIDRIRELSSVNYLEMMSWDRYKGIEEEKLKIRKEIPLGFINDIEEFDGKYSIFRLYKGNEPTPGRVIGKLVNKVFYIFYIDVKGILYNHGH